MVAVVFKFIGLTLLALIALVVLLLHFSAVVRVHLGADGFSFNVKYLGFTVFPMKKKESKKKDDEDAPKSIDDDVEVDDEIAELDLEDDFEELEDFEKADNDSTEKIQRSEKSSSAAESIGRDTEVVKSDVENSEKISEKEDKEESKEKSDVRSDAEVVSEQKKPNDSSGKKAKSKSGGKLASLRAKYEFIKPYIPYTWKMFKKLLKAVRIRIDNVSLMISREDAHEAAIYYGGLQSVISTTIMTLGGMFTLKVKRCDINCGFAKNDFDVSADISVRVRPSAVIAICVCIGANAAVIFIRQKLAARKKTAAGEST